MAAWLAASLNLIFRNFWRHTTEPAWDFDDGYLWAAASHWELWLR